MNCWELADPFGDREPTEEEYNREVEQLKEFMEKHPNDRCFSRMLRRAYCPRCHKQMEIENCVCVCYRCRAWVTDTATVVDRAGVRHTLYELYPEEKAINEARLRDFECLD